MAKGKTTPGKSAGYVWFDAEFTSLDLDLARLLQVAAIVTDPALGRLASPADDLDLCIRLDEGESLSPWVEENLSGLVAKSRSDMAVPIDEADRRLAALVDRLCGTPCAEMDRRPVLAGNSIHNDWFLVRKYLPLFASRLHYRLLDVSAIKIQWQDWAGQPPFDKENAGLINLHFPGAGVGVSAAHDALFDIKASIAELAFYRSRMGLLPVAEGL